MQDWGDLDYAFLSPIYNSISKQGYSAAQFSDEDLRAAIKSCGCPVIALGGITVDKLPELHELGFAGVAVIGSVWLAADPMRSFEELKSACDALAAT